MTSDTGKKSSDEKNEKDSSQKKKKRITVKQLREKHMKDKNHVITDEEMKDLKLDLEKPDKSTSHTPDLPDDKNRPKDEDKDPKIITPWNLIEDE